jgi:hypothetical protein
MSPGQEDWVNMLVSGLRGQASVNLIKDTVRYSNCI